MNNVFCQVSPGHWIYIDENSSEERNLTKFFVYFRQCSDQFSYDYEWFYDVFLNFYRNCHLDEEGIFFRIWMDYGPSVANAVKPRFSAMFRIWQIWSVYRGWRCIKFVWKRSTKKQTNRGKPESGGISSLALYGGMVYRGLTGVFFIHSAAGTLCIISILKWLNFGISNNFWEWLLEIEMAIFMKYRKDFVNRIVGLVSVTGYIWF